MKNLELFKPISDKRQAYSVKEVYEYLELSPAHFARWTKNNIEDNPYATENEDYVVFTIEGENPQGGRPSADYAVTATFAKKLCMLSKSQKGEEARDYFIDCEKKSRELEMSQPVVTRLEVEFRMSSSLGETAARMLNWNESSKLRYLTNVAKEYGLPSSLLPAYTPSRGVLIPLSKILDGTGYSAKRANPILESKGVLEKKWRTSSGGAQKWFWNINSTYSYLGENQVNSSNPKETQPLYYENKKQEIIKLILLEEAVE